MGRFVEGADRSQLSFLPECLEDWVDEDNPVQVIEAFVEALNLVALGFIGATPANTGRPGLSSGGAVEALYLWLSQPSVVEPTA